MPTLCSYLLYFTQFLITAKEFIKIPIEFSQIIPFFPYTWKRKKNINIDMWKINYFSSKYLKLKPHCVVLDLLVLHFVSLIGCERLVKR